MKPSCFLVSLLLGITINLVQAEDLGVIGHTYEITERDLIEVMQAKLRQMESTGELKELEKKHRNRVIASIEHPKPVKGVIHTVTPSFHYYDPSIITGKDIINEKGQILFPRGTRVNPLDYVGMSSNLLFIDGSDSAQLEFSQQVERESDKPVKLVLVAGEPLLLMKKWKKQIYYDQGGTLTRRFAITQVPAIVRQEGKRLRIDELRY